MILFECRNSTACPKEFSIHDPDTCPTRKTTLCWGSSMSDSSNFDRRSYRMAQRRGHRSSIAHPNTAARRQTAEDSYQPQCTPAKDCALTVYDRNRIKAEGVLQSSIVLHLVRYHNNRGVTGYSKRRHPPCKYRKNRTPQQLRQTSDEKGREKGSKHL